MTTALNGIVGDIIAIGLAASRPIRTGNFPDKLPGKLKLWWKGSGNKRPISGKAFTSAPAFDGPKSAMFIEPNVTLIPLHVVKSTLGLESTIRT